MIPLLFSVVCFLGFLLFELFHQSLDRISPIKLRGLVEENPGRLRILAGQGESAVVRGALGIVVQILLLVSFGLLIGGLAARGVRIAWFWGGGGFLVAWLAAEGIILQVATRISPEALLPRLGPVVSALSWALAPLALPLRGLFRLRARDEGPASEEEIQAYIDVGREEGILEKEEERLLASIVDFGDTMVKEVMTPRTDIVGIPETASLQDAADRLIETKYSRLPLFRGSIDSITGLLHIKDALEAIRRDPDVPLTRLARPVDFVPETKGTADLLREFQRRHLAFAVVVDEYGSVSGIVTIEDLLEEIVGEIADEHEDERDAVVSLPGGAFSIAARTHVDVLHELFGRGPEEEEFDTIGGFLSSRLGRIPRVGETRDEAGLRFTVEEADRRRVLRVRVEALALPEEAAGERA